MADRPTEMDEFLLTPRMARLATTNANGTPHLVPLVYLFRPEEGTFFFSTGAESVTVRNLRRNPAITVCVDDDEFPFRAVIVEGEAQISEVLGTDHEGLKMVVDHYYGLDMWAKWVNTPSAQKIRVRLTVVPKKWKWWDGRRELQGSRRVG